MDETLRDVYNRFGENALADLDPRKDELKLLSDLAFTYIIWFIVIYILTLDPSARAARTWGIFAVIGMVATEVTFCLTETNLPKDVPFNLTEFEVIEWMHLLFPGILLLMQAVSQYTYVDIDRQCSLILCSVVEQQKVSSKFSNLSLQCQLLILSMFS